LGIRPPFSNPGAATPIEKYRDRRKIDDFPADIRFVGIMFSILRPFLVFTAVTLLPAGLSAGEDAPPPSPQSEGPTQVLVFSDGDRVRGNLIGRDGEFLVFQSQRFGELVVPSEGVRIENIPPTPKPVAATPPEPKPEEETEPETPPAETVEMRDRARPYWASPAALATALGDFLGAWKGRFSVSASVITKTREQRDLALGLKVQREWEEMKAEFDFRYDLRKTEGVINTDLIKSNGLLRREISDRYFVQYRPTAEWNRNYRIAGIPAEYVLLQQELGIGIDLLTHEQRAVRLGIAENMFSVWTLSDNTNRHRDNQSLFTEIEFDLPWRISVVDRYTWFTSLFGGGEQGWENRLEVNKKFNDALSLGLRQEARRNNPDTRVEDYSLWRILIGLDF